MDFYRLVNLLKLPWVQTVFVGLATGIISSKVSASVSFSPTTIVIIILILLIFYILIRLVQFFVLYQGISFLDTSQEIYMRDIAKELENVSAKFFFKGFTGHEFFSNKLLRNSFEKVNASNLTKFVCLFSSPNAQAYRNEGLTQEEEIPRFRKKHELALEYFQIVASSLIQRNENLQIDTGYVSEEKNLVNALLIDDIAYVFIRGVGAQTIFKINLKKCNYRIRNIINYIFEVYFPLAAVMVEPVKASPNSSDGSY